MARSGSNGAGRHRGHGPVVVSIAASLVLGLLFLSAVVLLSPRESQTNLAAIFPEAAAAGSPDPASFPERGRLYVPVYSSNATGSSATRIDFTATLSIRNVSQATPLLIERVDYHSTSGALVRSYLEEPRTVAPLGTMEVVIADREVQGGTREKFLVDWAGPTGAPGPLTEAVMIGIYGSQGFSFISPGRLVPR